MAITFVAAGAQASGTGAITAALPSGIQTDDLLLLVVETANQAVTLTGTDAANWTQIASSPQGTGTAGGTAATRVTVYYRWVDGTQTNIGIADSGDHQVAGVGAYRGVDLTTPFNAQAGQVNTTANTTCTFASVTTTVANCDVLLINARALPDSNTNTQTTNHTNATLTGITTDFEYNTNAGNGGGFCVASGLKATAGATGTSTATNSVNTVTGAITLALKPAPQAFELNLESGSFTYTGQDATLSLDLSFNAEAGSFTYTGEDATLTKTAAPKEINAAAGSFSYTGQDATFVYNPVKQIDAAAASFSISGQNATLSKNSALNAESGSFTYTGQAADLTYTSAGRSLDAAAGSFSIAGQNAEFLRSHAFNAESGAYGEADPYVDSGYVDPYYATNLSAALGYGRVFNASAGVFSYTGQDATLYQAYLYPLESDVRAGVHYGPGGMYVGTLTAENGEMIIRLRSFTERC